MSPCDTPTAEAKSAWFMARSLRYARTAAPVMGLGCCLLGIVLSAVDQIVFLQADHFVSESRAEFRLALLTANSVEG
jgi:hypothetical protein